MGKNIGVVLAGGVGNRYGSKVPKQYLLLNGKEVIYYPIKALKKSISIDTIIVACDKLYQGRIKQQYDVEVCDGGDTRNITVQNVLDYVYKHHKECDKIIFIDSARPLSRSEDIDVCINKLNTFDIVITGQKITDSLGCNFKRYVNREDYYLLQTPEAFKFDLINNNFDVNSNCTALCQQMPEDTKLFVYYGLKNNLKITYPGDISYIENNFNELLK